ncbi:MAG: hypothetical protein JSV44_04335 [Candidatus Zixiibacteriota bacterium]|nr:MAG: hypothetical protein JSV44_04335 [candidate division Zixibacteria bacterium]
MKAGHILFARLSVGALAFCLVFGSPVLKAENLTITLEAGDYRIIDQGSGEQMIMMDDFGRLLVPGKPMLPARTFLIALPPGAQVLSVALDDVGAREIPGQYNIKPAPPVLPADLRSELVRECRLKWQRNYDLTYSSDVLYPAVAGEYSGTGALRKYNFVKVAYAPFSYRPQSGTLVFRPSLTLSIDYSIQSSSDEELFRLLSDTKGDRRAARLLVNYA